MAKLSLTDIASGYQSLTTYNANNDLIEAAVENTLSRDGTSPNTMAADLDMNSNNINNVGTITTNAYVTGGAGSPEGVLTGVVGTLYTRTDGGANTTLYVKESGVGNTGWVAK